MGKTIKRLAIGTALAGAAGYVAGLLTAPSSGQKTRRELKKTAAGSVRDVENQLKDLQSELASLVDEARDHTGAVSGRTQKKLAHALDNARHEKDKLRQVLSSLHEGEASDKDLRKAVADAKHSIEHIRDFIRK